MAKEKDYVGVFKIKKAVYVFVGDRHYFPKRNSKCKLLFPIETCLDFEELYRYAMSQDVLFGGLTCFPNCLPPANKWKAICMTGHSRIDDVVDSAYNCFKKYFPKRNN